MAFLDEMLAKHSESEFSEIQSLSCESIHKELNDYLFKEKSTQLDVNFHPFCCPAGMC